MKTNLDYKALDATREERLARIAEALLDAVMSARAPAPGHQTVPGTVTIYTKDSA